MTPSLPTFSMASARMLPISVSLLAATVATCRQVLLVLDLDRHVLELGDDVVDGLLDAALHLHGLTPATTALQAFVEDGFGQHGGGGGAVAGDVAGLAATSLTIAAPMFS